MKLKIEKKINLKFVGDGWEECYITLRPLSMKDISKIQAIPTGKESIQKATDMTLDLLKNHFIDCKLLTDKGVVSGKADNLEDMPPNVLSSIIENLIGQPSPNESGDSGTQ